LEFANCNRCKTWSGVGVSIRKTGRASWLAGRAGDGVVQKLEIRKPKQIRIQKIQNQRPEKDYVEFSYSGFEFVSDFGFRIFGPIRRLASG